MTAGAGRLSCRLCVAGAACLSQRRHGVQAAERASAAGHLARAAARPPVAALQEGLGACHRAGRRYLREAPGQVTPRVTEGAGRLRARRACREARPVEAGLVSSAARRARRFGSAQSVPQVCRALQKAAYDPRVSGVLFKISPLAARPAPLLRVIHAAPALPGTSVTLCAARPGRRCLRAGRRSAGRACRSCASTSPSSGRAASSPWPS